MNADHIDIVKNGKQYDNVARVLRNMRDEFLWSMYDLPS